MTHEQKLALIDADVNKHANAVCAALASGLSTRHAMARWQRACAEWDAAHKESRVGLDCPTCGADLKHGECDADRHADVMAQRAA